MYHDKGVLAFTFQPAVQNAPTHFENGQFIISFPRIEVNKKDEEETFPI